MTAGIVIRIAMWAAVAIFFADAARRCWVVEAWSLLPLALLAVLFALANAHAAWCSRRRPRQPIRMMRIKPSSFPEQPKRGVR